ncbi:MAG: trimethylamine methyltransferase family protein [Planctomycetota bacterium]
MLSENAIEVLAGRALQMLWEVGVTVENEEVTRLCLAKGCRAGTGHRIRIPREIVEELTDFQRPTQDEYELNHKLIHACGPDWTHHLVWTGQADAFRKTCGDRFLMQAFDCGPTAFYDDGAGRAVPVNTEVFERMMKLAEATPEVGYTSMWYRQEVPPMIERLEALRLSMDLTTKFAGIEAIYPEVIPYLKEASEILTGDSKSSAYLAGSECMSMPLILEARSAEDILARKKCGVNRYHIASMPTLGVSTPVTLAGAIVMGAAEVLGGMAIAWCVDPGSDISGRMITLVADMRNGNSTTFGPYYAQYNNAVRQLFNERWGGHCMVEVFFSPTAQRPGLQAVFENFYGTSCRQRWEDDPGIPYAGMGTLHNGGLGSPTQLILDMEIRKAQWAYREEIAVDEETMDFDEVVAVTREGGNFLTSDHTMRHFREMWTSDCFRSESPFRSEGWDGTEKAILAVCEEKWRANLARWEPPAWPAEKIKEMDALLARARREFGIGG